MKFNAAQRRLDAKLLREAAKLSAPREIRFGHSLETAQAAMRARQNKVRLKRAEEVRCLRKSRFWPEFFLLCRRCGFSSQHAQEFRHRILFGPQVREAMKDARVLRILRGDPGFESLWLRR